MGTAAAKLRSVVTRWSTERVFQRSFGFTDSASSHCKLSEWHLLHHLTYSFATLT